MTFALVAQWIEHPPPKGRVTRSIRVEGANLSTPIPLKAKTGKGKYFVKICNFYNYVDLIKFS